MRARLRSALDALLHLRETPHRAALAFGIGVWIAFFPILGIHTVMALAIAWGLRLSKAAVLIGAYVNNPWTIGPLYMAGTLLGCALLGVSAEGLASVDFDRRGWDFYRELVSHLAPYAWPFVLGNAVLGVAGGLAGYLAVRVVLQRRLDRRAGAEAT